VRLVGEAVAEFKGEKNEQLADVKVELPVDAHLPHDYIPGERLRLEAYRKIASATTDEELTAVQEELNDRYGAPPAIVDNLLAVAAFRSWVRRYGIADVATQGKFIRFVPLDLRESQTLRLQRLYPGSIVKPASRIVLVPAPQLRDRPLLDWCRDLLDTVIGELTAAVAG
jgi:transcription-repair coupling factor (superfamily II helicase)